MTAATRLFDSVDDMASAAVDRIEAGIRAASSDGRVYLLGCPGGRTPRPVYQAFAQRAAETNLDCSGLIVVMMDDYVEIGASGPALVNANVHYSCRRFAEREIKAVINQGLAPKLQVANEHVWMPDPRDPSAYDRRIEEAGGVDLFLVASGATDGHVAFCGPGGDLEGGTSVVELAPQTRSDNMVTFPDFADLSEVPSHGVSIGLGAIRRLSDEVLLLLHGTDKQLSAQRVAVGTYKPDWPATFIHECRKAEIWIDRTAREGSQR